MRAASTAVRRPGSWRLAVLFLAFLAVATPSRAAGLRRLDSAWLLPAPLQAHLLREDAGARTRGGTWARVAQARLYGLPELPVRMLSAGTAGGFWAVEAGWESLGSGSLRDDRLSAALSVGRTRRLGLRGHRRLLQPGPGPAARAVVLELEVVAGGIAPRVGAWQVGACWPLVRTEDAWLAPEPERRLSAALAGPGRAFAVAVDVGADGKPAFGWEALAGLGPGLALAWRADIASGAAGGGLIWQGGLLRLRTSHLGHPELGLTHRVELCIGKPGGAPW